MSANKAQFGISRYVIIKKQLCLAIALTAAFTFSNSINLWASPLSWLKSKVTKRNSQTTAYNSRRNRRPVIIIKNNPSTAELTGQSLGVYKYVQSRWAHSKKILSAMCKIMVNKINDSKAVDITKKLFSIDIQSYKESVKAPAVSIKEIKNTNDILKNKLIYLNKIVSSPQKETLAELEKTVKQLKSENYKQSVTVKKYLKEAEGLIKLGSQSYETLELIPSLSQTSLDLFVQASKRLMKQIQSNGEAFKGLLLNIQNSNEQIVSNLDMINNIVKSTLRFSDHFAIRQFPLINLPTPSREKIYVQLRSLKNAIKGIYNTLEIADSQTRNSSQQLSHLIEGLAAKVAESFKYTNNDNFENQEIAQISIYAQNQISGLYLRTQEILRATYKEMTQVALENTRNTPSIRIESTSEYMAKRAEEITQNKLPLFLLGGKSIKNNITTAQTYTTKNDTSSFIKMNSSQTLAQADINRTNATIKNTNDFSSDSSDSLGDNSSNSKLMPTEVNILQQELGQNFFFSDNDEEDSIEDDSDNSSNTYNNINDNDEVALDTTVNNQDNSLMKISYDNVNMPSEPATQLLQFDSLDDEEN